MACSQLLKDEEILEISLQFLAWHVFLFPTHFWICFTYFSGMEEATLRPFMADIAAIEFLAPYLRLAINYYFSFGRMNLDPREVSRYFGTEHHKVNFLALNWFLIEMNVKRCHISIIEMEKVHFFKGLHQPWLFNNVVSFWIFKSNRKLFVWKFICQWV